MSIQVQGNNGGLNISAGASVGQAPETSEDHDIAIGDNLGTGIYVGQYDHVSRIPDYLARATSGLD
jgi:hypothetical protein